MIFMGLIAKIILDSVDIGCHQGVVDRIFSKDNCGIK